MEANTNEISYRVVDTSSVRGEMPDFRPNMEARNFDDIFSDSPESRAIYDERFLPVLKIIQEIASRIPRDIFSPDDLLVREFERRFQRSCAPQPTFADLCRGLTGEEFFVTHIFALDSKPQPNVVGYLNAAFGFSDTFPGFPPFEGVGGYFAYAYVDPSVRRQGIFTGLMERGEQFMTECTHSSLNALPFPPGTGGPCRPEPRGSICRVMFNMHPRQRDFESLKQFHMARGYKPTGPYVASDFSTPRMPELEFFGKRLVCKNPPQELI